MAGTGSYDDEMRRYNLFMSSQGVICQNIRHFGGKYMKDKNPPEFDPDGSWYLCLDPEVSLWPGSCIVYSIGYNTFLYSFNYSVSAGVMRALGYMFVTLSLDCITVNQAS
jgi:hypothetical protein